MKRKIAAILAADIAEYSRLVAEDEEDALSRLGSYREVFEDFVGKAGGRVFNTAGDAVLAEFPSAVEATRCAIDIQESLRTRNLTYPSNRQMLFRIGITIGDVVERAGDLLGDGVNIAARLEGLAAPGGICVSRGVYEQVANKISVPFRDIGIQAVKNIPQRVHAFLVEMESTVPGAWRRPPVPRAVRSHEWRWPMLAGLVAGLVGLCLGAAALSLVAAKWLDRQENRRESAAPLVGTLVPPDASPAEAYAILAKSGGIVQDAHTAPELYHNARSFEARGDSVSARRDYLALAELGSEALDAHLRFAALLRAQEGRAGAREVFDRLRETTGTSAAALVHATLFEGDERRRRVEAFAAARADYAPAQMLLADEYSDDRIGTQTIADRRKEAEALGRFLAADAEGKLVRFFLDQSVLAEWLERARRRHNVLEANLATATLTPTAKFMHSNAGWSVALSLPEPATALAWRVGDAGDYVSSGFMSAIDQRTGRPMPNSSFELDRDTPATNLWIRYDDAAGRSVSAFPIPFDPHAALLEGQRESLERFWNSWIGFSSDGRLVYYTHLMSYRCAVAKAELGFDDGPLSVNLPIPRCDERDPHAIPGDAKVYLPAPAAAKSVSVRLTYFDGARSETRVFRRQ
ncbi:MAG: adenylate/guanylate cyclase domain-containing protein [Beijerinckiaceae bacterium]